MFAIRITVGDVVRWLEELAPRSLAEEWDNVGLQCGHPDAPVERVLTALTLTHDGIDQAIRLGASLIVAHHPLIFRPLRTVDAGTRVGSLLSRLIRHDIAFYASHTNLDAAVGGVNDGLARRLGLVDVVPLAPRQDGARLKLVTFVPPDHEDAVRSALAKAGAGVIGKYTHCTFAVPGEGTFSPQEGAEPHIGEVGRLERVKEIRLEAVLTDDMKERAVKFLKEAHPYEEVPVDLYRLVDSGRPQAGIGRIGTLNQQLLTEEFVKHVKNALALTRPRLAGARPTRVQRVAVVGGSGGSFVTAARAAGADALITGDVDYHDADEARALGLLVIDGGHFGTEKHVAHDLARYLHDRARRVGAAIRAIVAKESDAFWLHDGPV